MIPATFADLMADGADPELDELALTIAAALRGGGDIMEGLTLLDVLAGECPSPTPDGVARYLFDDLGFTGNREAYYDWHNSCLDDVLRTRTGIPITLSIAMIEVGRRIGVPLVGVGMPAHFLVGVAGEPNRFFDAFDGGRELDAAGAQALFAGVTGSAAGWDERHLAPTPNREIAIRVLNNLKAIFARGGDPVRLGIVMELRGAISELTAAEEDERRIATAVFN
jgi:regulator of sirC expression with transglutaminase-like and TPR domain